jgi:hypothetical protein
MAFLRECLERLYDPGVQIVPENISLLPPAIPVPGLSLQVSLFITTLKSIDSRKQLRYRLP